MLVSINIHDNSKQPFFNFNCADMKRSQNDKNVALGNIMQKL